MFSDLFFTFRELTESLTRLSTRPTFHLFKILPDWLTFAQSSRLKTIPSSNFSHKLCFMGDSDELKI